MTEEIATEKSFTKEGFGLWSKKALKEFLANRIKPVIGCFETLEVPTRKSEVNVF